MLDHAWNPASGTRLIRHVPGKSSAEVITFDPAAPQFSVMERHLFGCTTIVVVSRLGVYMAHLWEVPAFLSPDRGFTPPSFDTDVMEQVPNGDPGRTTMPSLLGLRGEGQILSPDEEWNTVHSFIITPRYENAQKHYGDGYIYKDLVSRIEAGMREWMPDSELKVVSYPQDPENADFHLEKAGKTARGKVLVQYDPKNYFEIQTERGPDGKRCIEWWSRVRMYVGTQSQTEFDDDWPVSLLKGGKNRTNTDFPVPRCLKQAIAVRSPVSGKTRTVRAPASFRRLFPAAPNVLHARTWPLQSQTGWSRVAR